MRPKKTSKRISLGKDLERPKWKVSILGGFVLILFAMVAVKALDLQILDRDRAFQLARKQHGVVSRDQLVALGIGKDGVAAAVQRGRLIRVHPHVYAVGHASLQPRARRLAAVLSVPGAVLGYGSAAALWGLRPAVR